MSTQTEVSNFVINYCTQEQFTEALNDGEIVPTQLYCVENAINLISTKVVATSGSTDIILSNNDKMILTGIGAGDAKVLTLVNCDGDGTVSYLKIAGSNNITFTTDTRKITITNGESSDMTVLILKY